MTTRGAAIIRATALLSKAAGVINLQIASGLGSRATILEAGAWAKQAIELIEYATRKETPNGADESPVARNASRQRRRP